MKTRQIGLFLFAGAVIAAVLYGWSGVLFAQMAPVVCTPASASATVGQPVTFSASGGDGNYVWAGQNLTVTNPTGLQFTVSYPNPGAYTITVTSAGQSSNCLLTVAAPSGVPAPTAPPGLPETGEGYFWN